MWKKLAIPCLAFALSPLNIESRSPNLSRAQRVAQSSCGKARGWMRISTTGIVGDLSCFSPEIHDGYASIGGGGVKGQGNVSIQMNFLSRAGAHSCKVPTVVIELRDNLQTWSAFQVGHAKFGDCSITQVFENGRKLWKGHVVANLVIVKGDKASGSPRLLHSEKDSSGDPITRIVEIDWEFDRFTQVPD